MSEHSLPRRQFNLGLLAPALLGPVAGGAWAQADWPAGRTIRIVSPSQPGGVTDVIARLLAERWARTLKTTVLVDNKPGGTGSLALAEVAKAAPDGTTLAIGFSGANVIHPLMNPKLPFNALKDFTAIGLMANLGNVMVVHPSLPIHNLAEFIAHAKAQPAGKPVLYGSWGNGSGGHLAGEYLKILTGVDLQHVPHRAMNVLVQDMMGGHMPVGFLDLNTARIHVSSGKLRAIAMTGPNRASVLPDVPTMMEQGVKFGIGIWLGLFGPANLPPAVLARLNAELRDALLAPEFAERWQNMFGGRPTPGTPEEFDRTVRAAWEVWKRVIEQGKVTAD
jgi:tripartite-type tricarboxylate transporter receptor subunit TctC